MALVELVGMLRVPPPSIGVMIVNSLVVPPLGGVLDPQEVGPLACTAQKTAETASNTSVLRRMLY